MAAKTTTIRVPTRTRDRLRALAAERGESAGEVVAGLVDAASEEAMLGAAAAGFERMAADPKLLVAYRAEAGEVDAFGAPAPEW